MNIQPRSYAYALATLLLALVVSWVGANTWRELRQLHKSFGMMQTDDLYISEHADALVRELNELGLRVSLRHEMVDKAAFESLTQDTREWIQTHQNTFSTQEQRALMAQIGLAFNIYLAEIERVMDSTNQLESAASAAAVVGQIGNAAAPLLRLYEKLKASDLAEQTLFIHDSERALKWIQQLMTVVLVIFIALMVTAAVALHRGVIGPLRSEMIRSRALAERNEKLASLGTLAAGVAHEIRNPLTAINVRLHGLQRHLAAGSSEEEDAQVIGGEIQRLDRLVKEFLQFARPAEPKLVTVSVDSLLSNVQLLFGSQLEKKGIRLVVDSPPDIWLRVDPHQIQQVLINLIQNASESIAENGAISVRVHSGKVRLTGQTDPAVILEVSDTGRGIPPEVQKRMFDPFFTTKEEGTGLGLVIALRIIEKHGGSLECHSEVNRGATFTITLPLATPYESHEIAT